MEKSYHGLDGWRDDYYQVVDGWLIGYYNRYKLVDFYPGLTDCAKVEYTWGQGQMVIPGLGVIEHSDVYSNITGKQIA